MRKRSCYWNLFTSYCWWFRNPAPVDTVSSLSHSLHGFIHPNGGWEWDFWTINSSFWKGSKIGVLEGLATTLWHPWYPFEPSLCPDHCQIWMWRTGGGTWGGPFLPKKQTFQAWEITTTNSPTHWTTAVFFWGCLAGGATLALNIPEFCPVSCKSPECPYRCSRDWKDGGEVPNTQQQRCGVLLVFLCLQKLMLWPKLEPPVLPGRSGKLRKTFLYKLRTFNPRYTRWPRTMDDHCSMVTGVGRRSTVVYRAWMQSSWVRWVPVVAREMNRIQLSMLF